MIIDKNVLESFQTNVKLSKWNGRVEDTNLFFLWKNLNEKVQENNNCEEEAARNIIIEVADDIVLEDIDWDNVGIKTVEQEILGDEENRAVKESKVANVAILDNSDVVMKMTLMTEQEEKEKATLLDVNQKSKQLAQNENIIKIGEVIEKGVDIMYKSDSKSLEQANSESATKIREEIENKKTTQENKQTFECKQFDIFAATGITRM